MVFFVDFYQLPPPTSLTGRHNKVKIYCTYLIKLVCILRRYILVFSFSGDWLTEMSISLTPRFPSSMMIVPLSEIYMCEPTQSRVSKGIVPVPENLTDHTFTED